jgi:hypothetical protein
MKTGLEPSLSPKTSPRAQNMKTGQEPSVPSKTSLGAQSMQTGPDVLSTVENESRNAKHENGTWRPRYQPKRSRERKT